jgi:DNA polymerase III alpha subunit
MPALALTDTNGMYGLIQFAQLAKEANIKPILGVYLDDPNDSEINAVSLAKNRDGYSKICELITQRQLDEKFSLVEALKQLICKETPNGSRVRHGLTDEENRSKNNVVIITASIKLLEQLKLRIYGEPARYVEPNMSGEADRTIPIRQLAGKFRTIYVEMFFTPKRKKLCRELYNFAREHNLPLVTTNAVHFISKDDYLLHKVLTAIKKNTTLSSLTDNDLADEEQYFKSPAEMMQLWRALPEAIANTEKIANECNVDLELGKYKPACPTDIDMAGRHPKFSLPKDETAFSYLWKISFQGLSEKYQPITEQAVNRLQKELRVIEQLGFADYFLIVWDIARQAHLMNMMMLGRGSAANSIVAYCLGLTQVDPLEHNLFFERFLNLGRASPPDVDLDFSWKERDAIVKYVFDKYGSDRVAMISTTVTFRARSAFREVAKVFGISEAEISEYSQYIPWTSAENLPHLAEKFPETRHLKFNDEPWKTIVNIAQKIAGFPRHLSIHPGGIVISPEPITNFTALEYAENKGLGLIITQPDMYPIEDLGLVKIDLLSQRSLGVVKDTIGKIRLRQRLRLSEENKQLDSAQDKVTVLELKKE